MNLTEIERLFVEKRTLADGTVEDHLFLLNPRTPNACVSWAQRFLKGFTRVLKIGGKEIEKESADIRIIAFSGKDLAAMLYKQNCVGSMLFDVKHPEGKFEGEYFAPYNNPPVKAGRSKRVQDGAVELEDPPSEKVGTPAVAAAKVGTPAVAAAKVGTPAPAVAAAKVGTPAPAVAAAKKGRRKAVPSKA